jgi:hypothetical protein
MKRPPRGAFSFSWFGELEMRTAVRQVRAATCSRAARESLVCECRPPRGAFSFSWFGELEML